MIAAANALTMSSVSPSMLISTSGASRMPASAASDDPIAHASDDARSGFAPCSAASVGLSTTARIARPMRERLRNSRRPTAIATPNDDRDEAVPQHERCRRPGSPGCRTGRGPTVDWFWFQIHAAKPMRNTMSATVAMSCTTRLLRAARLIANRSRNTPSAGAITSDDRATRQDLGEAPLLRELPVDERHEHADGALREVEDAARRVGDDEPGGGEGVDRSQRDAGDRRAQEPRPCDGRARPEADAEPERDRGRPEGDREAAESLPGESGSPASAGEVPCHRDDRLRIAVELADALRIDAHELAALDLHGHPARRRLPRTSPSSRMPLAVTSARSRGDRVTPVG